MPRRCPLALAAVALQPLDLGQVAVEVRPHLLDLVVERTALRRLAAEQREKASALATQAFELLAETVELGLLLCRGVLVALDLVRPAVDTDAAVEGGELAFEPQAGLAASSGCWPGYWAAAGATHRIRTGTAMPNPRSDFAMPVTVINWSPTRSLQSTMEAARW